MKIKEVFKKHPRPWRWEPAPFSGEDEHIVDAKGVEVLGVSEWLRCNEEVRDLITHCINSHWVF